MIFVLIYFVLAFVLSFRIAPTVAWDVKLSYVSRPRASDKFMGIVASVLWLPVILAWLGIRGTALFSSKTNYWNKPKPIRTPSKVLRDRHAAARLRDKKAVEASRKHINKRERELDMELTTWQ